MSEGTGQLSREAVSVASGTTVPSAVSSTLTCLLLAAVWTWRNAVVSELVDIWPLQARWMVPPASDKRCPC